jgi:colicin import membrane protein
VDQAQFELQLKVWKELAISKQMLMRTATDALKLDADCSQDELKKALETVIKQNKEAETSVITAQNQAKQSILAMERKVAASAQAQALSDATATELRATLDNATKQMAIERTAIAQEVQKLKDRLAEKDKALSAINTALADTPENVIKKMKSLRKEKQDESDERKKLEATFNTLRKDKQQQDKQLADLQASTTKLVTQYKDLHAVTTKLHEQLKPLVDEKDLPALPALDDKLLEAIEENGNAKKKGPGIALVQDRKSA